MKQSEYAMTKFEKWLLKRIFRRIVIQSSMHRRNITEVYRLLHKAASKQFNEDNKPTLDGFLYECFDDAHIEQSEVDAINAKKQHALEHV